MVDVHRGLDGSKNVSRVNLGRSVITKPLVKLLLLCLSSGFTVFVSHRFFFCLLSSFHYFYFFYFFSLLFIAPLFAMVEFPTLKRGIARGRFKRPGL